MISQILGLYKKSIGKGLVGGVFRLLMRKLLVNASNISWKFLKKNSLVSDSVVDEDSRVICTLTSHGLRIRHAWKTLRFLQFQSMAPHRLILYLWKGDRDRYEEVKQCYDDLLSRGLEIVWLENDLRSYKKYVPAFVEFCNSMVITLDDDIMYPPTLVEKLCSARKNFGAMSIVTCYAREVTSLNTDSGFFNGWKLCTRVYHDQHLFFGSGGGTLFVPSEFEDEVVQTELF